MDTARVGGQDQKKKKKKFPLFFFLIKYTIPFIVFHESRFVIISFI